MPKVVEIPGLSKEDADQRAQDLGIDALSVEIIPQDDGSFTVRATFPDDMEIPGAPPGDQASRSSGSPPAPGNGPTKISPKGIALIKEFESCKEPVTGGFRAYLDPVQVLTIGWGHTNHHGRRFDTTSVWTQAECDAELASDLAKFETAVNGLVTVRLNQDQFDALVSFTFNLGEGSLKQSTLLKKVNAGDFSGAAQEFARWNKADGKVLPGLVRRRASEALLFQSIPDSNYDGVPDR